MVKDMFLSIFTNQCKLMSPCAVSWYFSTISLLVGTKNLAWNMTLNLASNYNGQRVDIMLTKIKEIVLTKILSI